MKKACFNNLGFYKSLIGKTKTFQYVFPFKSDPYLEKLLNSDDPMGVYCGFDPTAEHLQIGNLVPLLSLLKCTRHGVNAIALIGGATGLIGDPSGRSDERTVLPAAQLRENCVTIQRDIENIQRNFAATVAATSTEHTELEPFKILNNHEWFKDFNVLDFSDCVMGRLQFRHIKLKRSFQDRLNYQSSGQFDDFSDRFFQSEISLREFLYPFFQAYDWLHLREHHGCQLQIGGQDQTGNISLGIELIARSHSSSSSTSSLSSSNYSSAFGLINSLLVGPDGKKLGKSVQSKMKLPKLTKEVPDQDAIDLYSSFVRLPSSWMFDKQQFIRLLTSMETPQIIELEANHGKRPQDLIAQKTLARYISSLVYGPHLIELTELLWDTIALSETAEGSEAALRRFDALFMSGDSELKRKLLENLQHFPIICISQKKAMNEEAGSFHKFVFNHDKIKSLSHTKVSLNGAPIDADLLKSISLAQALNSCKLPANILKIAKKTFFILLSDE